MRGILIDPVKREVTVIDVAKGLDGLYAAVFGEGKRGYVELVRIDGSIDLWVDEEGLLKPWEEQSFFRFRGTDRPFAGRGVLLGGDDGTGESLPAPERLTAEFVASRVEWVEPKDVRVPAPRFFSDDELDENMRPKPGAEGEALGPEWTFDNQPR